MKRSYGLRWIFLQHIFSKVHVLVTAQVRWFHMFDYWLIYSISFFLKFSHCVKVGKGSRAGTSCGPVQSGCLDIDHNQGDRVLDERTWPCPHLRVPDVTDAVLLSSLRHCRGSTKNIQVCPHSLFIQDVLKFIVNETWEAKVNDFAFRSNSWHGEK